MRAKYTQKNCNQFREIPNLRDSQIGEALEYPSISVNIDRIHAGQLGVTLNRLAMLLWCYVL